MTTDAVSAAGTAAGANSVAQAAGLSANQQISQQQFLTLFIEQLKNQDPLSPMQPDQLTAQLAQFSSLEQLTGINTRLDSLTDATKQTTSSSLLGLLGKQVQVDDGTFVIHDGQVPAANYTLDARADHVKVSVLAADGHAVRVYDLGAQDAGAHDLVFDGRDQNGGLLPDGTYTLEIAAQAPGAQAPTPVSLTTFATVQGVDLGADPPVLLAGDARIPFDHVKQIRDGQPGA